MTRSVLFKSGTGRPIGKSTVVALLVHMYLYTYTYTYTYNVVPPSIFSFQRSEILYLSDSLYFRTHVRKCVFRKASQKPFSDDHYGLHRYAVGYNEKLKTFLPAKTILLCYSAYDIHGYTYMHICIYLHLLTTSANMFACDSNRKSLKVFRRKARSFFILLYAATLRAGETARLIHSISRISKLIYRFTRITVHFPPRFQNEKERRRAREHAPRRLIDRSERRSMVIRRY